MCTLVPKSEAVLKNVLMHKDVPNEFSIFQVTHCARSLYNTDVKLVAQLCVFEVPPASKLKYYSLWCLRIRITLLGTHSFTLHFSHGLL